MASLYEKWIDLAIQQYITSYYYHSTPKNAYILEIIKVLNNKIIVIVSDTHHFIPAYIEMTPRYTNLKATLINIKKCFIEQLNGEFILLIKEYVVIGGASDTIGQPVCINYKYKEEAHDPLYKTNVSFLLQDNHNSNINENPDLFEDCLFTSSSFVDFLSQQKELEMDNPSSIFTNSILLSTNEIGCDSFSLTKKNKSLDQEYELVDDISTEEDYKKPNKCYTLLFDKDLMAYYNGDNIYNFRDSKYKYLIFYKFCENWPNGKLSRFENFALRRYAKKVKTFTKNKASIFRPTISSIVDHVLINHIKEISPETKKVNLSLTENIHRIVKNRQNNLLESTHCNNNVVLLRKKEILFITSKCASDTPYLYKRYISQVKHNAPNNFNKPLKEILQILRNKRKVLYKLERNVFDLSRLKFHKYLEGVSNLFSRQIKFHYTKRNKNKYFFVRNPFIKEDCRENNRPISSSFVFNTSNIKFNVPVHSEEPATPKKRLPEQACISNSAENIQCNKTENPTVENLKPTDLYNYDSIMFNINFDPNDYL